MAGAGVAWTADEFVAVLIRYQRKVRAVLAARRLRAGRKLALSRDPFEALVVRRPPD